MMDSNTLILEKLDELLARVPSSPLIGLAKPKKKYKPEDGRRDYKMVYKNSKGEISEREINIKKVTGKNDKVTILAFCFASDAIKNFNAGGVIELKNLQTQNLAHCYDDILLELAAWT